MAEKFKKISLFIDSGAFSAWSKNVNIDIDEYIAFIKKYIHYIDVYVNLDVIGDAENTYKNQKYMESKGLRPMPVFHTTREDVSWFERYMKEGYEYIGLGGMAGGDITKVQIMPFLDNLFTNYICGKDGIPKVKIHGFGMTSLSLMLRYPWYSVDSTSWVMTGRFGAIFVPKKKNGKYNYYQNPYKVNVSDQSTKQKDAGQHFNTFSKMEQQEIVNYLKEKGYEIGKKDKEGKVIVSGVQDDYKKRDEVNIIYFNDLQRLFPAWPWKFKLDKPKGFGLI